MRLLFFSYLIMNQTQLSVDLKVNHDRNNHHKVAKILQRSISLVMPAGACNSSIHVSVNILVPGNRGHTALSLVHKNVKHDCIIKYAMSELMHQFTLPLGETSGDVWWWGWSQVTFVVYYKPENMVYYSLILAYTNGGTVYFMMGREPGATRRSFVFSSWEMC